MQLRPEMENIRLQSKSCMYYCSQHLFRVFTLKVDGLHFWLLSYFSYFHYWWKSSLGVLADKSSSSTKTLSNHSNLLANKVFARRFSVQHCVALCECHHSSNHSRTGCGNTQKDLSGNHDKNLGNFHLFALLYQMLSIPLTPPTTISASGQFSCTS